ncbi:SDR family oxidoreductase [Isoptericola sp. F-RaC21]|uniref:SDR family NAD(P)-dependent oxidoreductase n=1 Tax=Isoptericola sp. F-RaC21 TaxID=3141452 RepID=UPI00315BC54F
MTATAPPPSSPGATGHALVTGAASGIGAAIVADLAAHGWEVTGVDVREDALTRALHEVRERTGAPLRPAVGDLADAEVPAAAVRDAWAHRPLDALVNAAGIYPAVPFFELTAEQWDRVQHVNVRAPFLAVQELGRLSSAAGRAPAVVNITSGAARSARPGTAPYSTSKAALTLLTQASAVELGPLGIRVNAVAPDFVDVASDVNPVTTEYADAVRRSLLPGPARPDHVASAVRLLLSDDAGWVTGTTLAVDGGASAGTRALPQHWRGVTGVQTPSPRPSPPTPQDPPRPAPQEVR